MAKGFASLSSKRLREVSSKGGKHASMRATKYKYTKDNAKANALLGVAKRQKNLADEALRRLVRMGFSMDDLTALNLTVKELIYYGGRTAKGPRRDELTVRILAHKG